MMQSNHPQPAQYLINKIKNNLATLHKVETICCEINNHTTQEEMEIKLTWIAGHEGSKGNEEADILVKNAAEFSSSNSDLLPPLLHRKLPTSLSAIKQQITEQTTCNTKKWWKSSK
jgi:hypothetical protein